MGVKLARTYRLSIPGSKKGASTLTPEINRETQRAEFHKAIFDLADEVRRAVDGRDFKACILCFLFYRFLFEGLAKTIAGIRNLNFGGVREQELLAQIDAIVTNLEGQGA